jgi:hypothetical protein
MNKVIDDKHLSMVNKIIEARKSIEGFALGDFVEFKNTTRRISNIMSGRVQTSDLNDGSYHIFRSGYASFSGGLYSSLENEKLELTKEITFGSFWIFYHGNVEAHNGIDILVPCKVWKVNAEAHCFKYIWE